MPSFADHVDRLSAAKRWTYRAANGSASEPAAWSALALAAHGRMGDALRPAAWLASIQQADGSVGISDQQNEPRWPTSLAISAWHAADRARGERRFAKSIEAAVQWSLDNHGESAPRSPHIGHDTELVGWSWAASTHSWLEPTCFFVIALRAAGFGDHPRVREGVRLIVDRLLPQGGANYGNTIVLEQPLVPHVQPTGIAMLAIAGEPIVDQRVAGALEYLEQSIGPQTAPASLAFACLGLAAHDRRPQDANEWCLSALSETKRGPLAAYEQALLLLAARPNNSEQVSEFGLVQ